MTDDPLSQIAKLVRLRREIDGPYVQLYVLMNPKLHDKVWELVKKKYYNEAPQGFNVLQHIAGATVVVCENAPDRIMVVGQDVYEQLRGRDD